MKIKSLALALVASAALAGCAKTGSSTGADASALAPTTSSGPLAMTLTFAPSPPKQGAETITIALHDGGGTPIKGATVTVVTHMPAMSMTGPSLTLQDNGDGTYAAVANLNYPTKWVFDADASSAAGSGRAEFAVDIR